VSVVMIGVMKSIMKGISASFVMLAIVGCGRGGAKPDSNGGFIIPGRSDKYLGVSKTFGPSVVYSGEWEAEIGQRPWSAHFYPVSSNALFDGSSSPLRKYDEYLKKAHNQAVSSAKFERERLYDPGASDEVNLSKAWAIASILEQEPRKPITLNEIQFQVGDLKALLIKSYEVLEGAGILGEVNDGGEGIDAMDLYPDQFHRYLQIMLGEKRQAFVLDTFASPEAWYRPAYRAFSKIAADAGDPRLMHVETWVWLADLNVPDPNFVGTVPLIQTYTYDLYGEPRSDGGLEVRYGVWTDVSATEHPDFVMQLPIEKKRKSRNEELKIDRIDELLGKARQSGG